VSGPSGLFEAASLFVERGLFERVGGFGRGLEAADEAPFGEDALFGWAARRAGAVAGFCGDAVVYHAVTRRGIGGFVRERTRLEHFPGLVRDLPELREELCFWRFFLTRRSAAFDLAIAGALTALIARRRLPLVWTLPYVGLNTRESARWGMRLGPRVAVGTLLADGVGAVALGVGSLRSRTPLL
jgi:GT2 family glycosyltransferase